MAGTIFPLIFSLFMSMAANSQERTPDDSVSVISDSTKRRKAKVEVEARFPGGNPAWTSYLGSKLDPLVPARLGAANGRYKVIVRFIISKDGSIRDIVAETNHGFGMEEELTRIIKRAPKWIPASQDGIPVNAYRKQPITFVVSR